MQCWRTVLFSGKNRLGKVNIIWGIFQGDSLLPLVFVIALIPVAIILRTLKQKYSFGKEKEMLNHLLFMDDPNCYGSNNSKIDSLETLECNLDSTNVLCERQKEKSKFIVKVLIQGML